MNSQYIGEYSWLITSKSCGARLYKKGSSIDSPSAFADSIRQAVCNIHIPTGSSSNPTGNDARRPNRWLPRMRQVTPLMQRHSANTLAAEVGARESRTAPRAPINRCTYGQEKETGCEALYGRTGRPNASVPPGRPEPGRKGHGRAEDKIKIE